jgi:hypothetical protein
MVVVACPLFFGKFRSEMIVVRCEFSGRLGAGWPDVKQEVRDALQGHGENGVSAQYGMAVYRKTLDEAMKKVEYPDLDLSHLIVRN